MGTKLFVVSALITSVAMAQADRRAPTDRSDVVERLAASEIVVIGTVIQQDLYVGVSLAARYAAITPETSREALLTLQQQFDREVGTLYTIRVDEELCRDIDFQSEIRGPRSPAPKSVYVFIPSSDLGYSSLHDQDPKEGLGMQGKFLLMLRRDTASTELVKTYGLDAAQTYYRALAHARGAIQLELNTYKQPEFYEAGLKNMPLMGTSIKQPNRAVPNLVAASVWETKTREADAIRSDVSAVCQAVRPANTLQKADGLERLKSSPDLVTRKNADIALKILRGEPIK